MKYYVYHLIDPRTQAPFYVGKGSRGRMFEHCKDARRGVQSRKCARILEIEALGLEITHRVVERFADEAEAYAFEAQEIVRIGLSALTNEVPGGNGGAANELAWHIVVPALRGLAKHLRLIEVGKSLLVSGQNMDGVALEYVRQLYKNHGARLAEYLMANFGLDARKYGCAA